MPKKPTDLITTAEAARRRGVSHRRMRALVTEGKLTPHRLSDRLTLVEAKQVAALKIHGKPGRPKKSA